MKQPNFNQSPEPIIREITPDDAENVRKMHAESWRETYPSPENGVSREWVETRTAEWFTPEKLAESREFIAKIINDQAQFYRVAEQDGQIVGMIHGLVRQNGSGHLWGLYTDKSQHGTGLARRLMAALDEFFAEKGVKKIDLEVASYNARAIRFYEKNGFTIKPDSEHLFADVMPTVNMEREIE